MAIARLKKMARIICDVAVVFFDLKQALGEGRKKLAAMDGFGGVQRRSSGLVCLVTLNSHGE